MAWCANTPLSMASSWCNAQSICSSTCESGSRAPPEQPEEAKPDCQAAAKLGQEKCGRPLGGHTSLESVLAKDEFENQPEQGIICFIGHGQKGQTEQQVRGRLSNGLGAVRARLGQEFSALKEPLLWSREVQVHVLLVQSQGWACC